MVDDPGIPALAASAVGRTAPGAKTVDWRGLGGGDLSRTWRVTFDGDPAATAIVKWTAARTGDASFATREAQAYSGVLDRLEARTPRLLSSATDSGSSCVVIEDLAGSFRFHDNEHRWSEGELRCLIPAYARLHSAGYGIGREPWMLTYQSPDWSPDTVEADAGVLQRNGAWGQLPDLATMARDTLAQLASLDGHASLLHLDCDPSNAGIAREEPCDVAFIDWDMAGWGAPELDLSYLYLHPFEPAAALDRAELLDLYWTERERTGIDLPGVQERRRRQAISDRALALALVRVARRSLDADYLPGKRAERYWSVMRPLLYRRLVEIIG